MVQRNTVPLKIGVALATVFVVIVAFATLLDWIPFYLIFVSLVPVWIYLDFPLLKSYTLKDYLRVRNFYPTNTTDYITAIVGVCIVYFAIFIGFVASSGRGLPENPISSALTGGDVIIYSLLSVFVLSPVEEFVFRQYIQEQKLGGLHPVSGISLSSLLFAVIHTPLLWFGLGLPIPTLVATLFGVNVVLGILYVLTRTLIVTSLVQSAVIVLSLFALFFV